MKSRGKWAFWVVAGALAVIALVYALRPDPTWIDMAVATRDSLEVTIREEGRTRVQDRYVVSAPVAGYLHRVDLEVGDRVIPGELLTHLEPMPAGVLDARSRAEAQALVAAARSALNAARQQVNAAEADAELARDEYQRLEKLLSTDFVSREQLQQARAILLRAEASLRSARFNAEVAEHELAAARTRLEVSAAREGNDVTLERVPVRSPVNGAVLQLLRKSEGVIQAGAPVLELGNPDALEIVVEVLSFDAVNLAAGIPMRLHGWGGPTLEARVRRVEPVGFVDISALGVEEQRVQVIADLTSPQPVWAALGDGYRVDAEFLLWRGEDVLQIPASALFTLGQERAVFMIEDGVARTQVVQVGRSNGLYTEITAGLTAGDQVVRHPDGQLADGIRVRVR